jgi:hypothetical protein
MEKGTFKAAVLSEHFDYNGFVVVDTDDTDETTNQYPVVGWAFDEDGTGEPLILTGQQIWPASSYLEGSRWTLCGSPQEAGYLSQRISEIKQQLAKEKQRREQRSAELRQKRDSARKQRNA